MHQISKTLFCHKILQVSGIFCAHHQELSTVHKAIGTFHAGYVTASKQSQFGTWWAKKMSETCRIVWQKKFWIFDASSWLFYTKLLTMYGHLNIKVSSICKHFSCCSSREYVRIYPDSECCSFRVKTIICSDDFVGTLILGHMLWTILV
jgi:hypothetical protein